VALKLDGEGEAEECADGDGHPEDQDALEGGLLATVRMMSAATSSSSPKRMERPTV
jgi:hypothetical protein